MRCGDVSFRLPDAPSVLLQVDHEEVPQGGTLQVRAMVRGARRGVVRLSLDVARYGRADCTVAPDVRKARIGAEGDGAAEFTVTMTPDAAAQAYYVTAYAVQDLAVTTARHHFGVVPAPGTAIRPLQDQ